MLFEIRKYPMVLSCEFSFEGSQAVFECSAQMGVSGERKGKGFPKDTAHYIFLKMPANIHCTLGRRIRIIVQWPALLHGCTELNCHAAGVIDRLLLEEVWVKVLRHEMRTRGQKKRLAA